MAKKQAFNWMSLAGFALPLAAAIGTYFVLQYRVDAAEKQIEKVEAKQEASQTSYSNVQVSQAKIEAKLESQDEVLKDIKELLKGLNK